MYSSVELIVGTALGKDQQAVMRHRLHGGLAREKVGVTARDRCVEKLIPATRITDFQSMLFSGEHGFAPPETRER